MAETKRKWVRTRELGEDEGGGCSGIEPLPQPQPQPPHYSISGSALHGSLTAGLLTCAARYEPCFAGACLSNGWLPLESVYVGLIQIGFNYFDQQNLAIPTEL
ncbi:Hypothetical predicted protein [Prunus dulcis]|uniref:Uncharacterized protein n=1 Tax=Prunus dulcis TaxID=3755 RepID=A0A5E4EQ26_PRUDU|nr:Hypothetical predicted protein [Prunus dulcis]